MSDFFIQREERAKRRKRQEEDDKALEAKIAESEIEKLRGLQKDVRKEIEKEKAAYQKTIGELQKQLFSYETMEDKLMKEYHGLYRCSHCRTFSSNSRGHVRSTYGMGKYEYTCKKT